MAPPCVPLCPHPAETRSERRDEDIATPTPRARLRTGRGGLYIAAAGMTQAATMPQLSAEFARGMVMAAFGAAAMPLDD